MNREELLIKLMTEEEKQVQRAHTIASQMIAFSFGDELEALQKEFEEAWGMAKGLRLAQEVVQNA